MISNLDFLLDDDDSRLSQDIEQLESREGELYLRFTIPSGDKLALPAVAIREVMQQPPDRITPVPNVSPLLIGTVNLRGQVIWVGDLGQFLGDQKTLNTQRPEIPVIAIEDEETILGLVIDQLGQMDWRDPEQLQKNTDAPSQMAPFIQGEWILAAESRQTLKLLDHVSILRSARWAV